MSQPGNKKMKKPSDSIVVSTKSCGKQMNCVRNKQLEQTDKAMYLIFNV